MITYTTAPQRVAAKVSRTMALTLLTAATSLCFGLLVVASLPGSPEANVPAVLPVTATLLPADTSVPLARADADQLPEAQPDTF